MSIKEKKCFILDMDGTIYLGNNLLPKAKELISLLEKQNKKYLFLTNNSSKSAKNYKKKLSQLGIEVDQDTIFTSGAATCIYLKSKKFNCNVYLLGTDELKKEFIRYGINVVNQSSQVPDYVVLGFDTTLNYKKIWEACDYIREGIPFIATHPDLNCPIESNRFMPDCGAMIEMFKAATGVSPKIIGKPYKEIVECIFAKTGFTTKEIAIVGDRLYTDIQTGINSGILSILVLSGETKYRDLRNSQIQPDIILGSIAELHDMLI